MSEFPTYRGRRLRRTEGLRSLVRETRLAPSDLILPLFVVEGEGVRRPVGSMPGVDQTSLDELVRDAGQAHQLGLGAVMLFGIPEHKDERGSGGYDRNGIVQRAIREIKNRHPELVVITDVCLCEYTSHGHCGLIVNGDVDNDSTLPLLADTALSHAEAGADIVAPSDMMDGRVATIRQALDENGHTATAILAYAAKFASAFYGPFREAAESAPEFGDRRSYQMDSANGDEAVREAWLDVEEGADILMVKPALPCLDIVRRIKEETRYPVCAYQVSGEYAAIRAAGERGWLDADRALMEATLSIRRAGADMVVTYHSRELARQLGG